ncbi:MAG: hypothetical protein ACRDZN_04155 [Acidimicrobiales bacterium]
MRRVLALAVLLALPAGGCGDDDDDERVDLQPADGVTVEASPIVVGDEVMFDVTVTNSGDRPLGIVDPEDGGYTSDLDGGGLRMSLLRASAEGGSDAALPPDDGLYLAPGQSVDRTARVNGGWSEPLPVEVEVCVEVITDDVRPDDGTASFPYRRPDDPIVAACTGRLTVAAGRGR